MKEISISELEFIYDLFIEIKDTIDLSEVDEALDMIGGILDYE